MREIFRVLPELSQKVHYKEIGKFPTPTVRETVPGIGKLFLKRDDLAYEGLAGSKVRKLEFIAPLVEGRRWVTTSSEGSNWCKAALALFDNVSVVTFPQVHNETSSETRKCIKALGRAKFSSSYFTYGLNYAGLFLRRGVKIIPPGGTTVETVIATASGLLEALAEMKEVPDYIFVPAGTCGLAAGSLVALDILGQRSKVIGIAITYQFVANALNTQRLRRAALKLVSRKPGSSTLRIVSGFMGPTYGYPTKKAVAARDRFRRAGCSLDISYSAKCAAALLEFAAAGALRNKSVLFWVSC